MLCNHCGREIKEGSKICPYCGTRLWIADDQNDYLHNEKSNRTTKKRNRTMWIIIASSAIVLLMVIAAFLFIRFSKERLKTEGTATKDSAVFRVMSPTLAQTTETIEPSVASESVAEDSFSISQSDLEAEIEKIRTYYYKPGDDDKKIVLENGTNGWNYSRDYRFHHNKPVFAFIFDGTEEHRLYFKDDHMIRYIDENHVTYDYPDTSGFQSWADRAIAEAYELIDGDVQAADASGWLGTWKADNGESLDITDVTENGLILVFHKFSEQGNMMDSDYVMEFDNDKKTIASEIGSPEERGLWEYTFILSDDHITVKSRSYYDQLFYKE